MSVLPHSSVIHQDCSTYLSDVNGLVAQCTAELESSEHYRHIYKISLALSAVLAKVRVARHKPSLTPAVQLVRRLPLVLAIGQTDMARLELRKLTEMVFWTIYFTDHAIEWKKFSTADGISNSTQSPIEFAARREPSYYRNYARELMDMEPSGMAKAAVNALSVDYQELSPSAHGAKQVRLHGMERVSLEISPRELRSFGAKYKKLAGNLSLLVCAFSRSQFDQLSAIERAWFDWLLGQTQVKKLRSRSFGLG